MAYIYETSFYYDKDSMVVRGFNDVYMNRKDSTAKRYATRVAKRRCNGSMPFVMMIKVYYGSFTNKGECIAMYARAYDDDKWKKVSTNYSFNVTKLATGERREYKPKE